MNGWVGLSAASRARRARNGIVRGLVAAALVSAACGRAESAATWTETDSAGVRIVANRAPRERWTLGAEPTLVLGDAAAPGEPAPMEFFQVRGLAFLPGGGFAVANAGTDQVRIFDADGRLRAEVGGRGNGPEEFSVLAHVWVGGDSLLAYDYRNDRVTVRDAAGALARSFRLEWFSGGLEPVAVQSDRTVLSVTARRMTEIEGTGLILDSALVSRYDLEGRLIDSIARFPHNQRVVFRDGTMQTTLALPFSVNGLIAAGQDGFCYAHGPAPSVRCFTHDGTPALRIDVEGAARGVRPQDIDAYWERIVDEGNPVAAQGARRRRESMIFPDTLPAFGELLADDAGRIWAQVYPRPDDPELEWQVFESGRWIARLAAPTALRLMAVADDRVLGVWRDELGVESIRMYRVSRE